MAVQWVDQAGVGERPALVASMQAATEKGALVVVSFDRPACLLASELRAAGAQMDRVTIVDATGDNLPHALDPRSLRCFHTSAVQFERATLHARRAAALEDGHVTVFVDNVNGMREACSEEALAEALHHMMLRLDGPKMTLVLVAIDEARLSPLGDTFQPLCDSVAALPQMVAALR